MITVYSSVKAVVILLSLKKVTKLFSEYFLFKKKVFSKSEITSSISFNHEKPFVHGHVNVFNQQSLNFRYELILKNLKF